MIILVSEVIGNFNIKTKKLNFEERVLIGWLANIQDACLNLEVQHFCSINIINLLTIINFVTDKTQTSIISGTLTY